jgi:hypothetical protein
MSALQPCSDFDEATIDVGTVDQPVEESVKEELRIERRFLGWLVGVASALLLLGTSVVGGILWNLNSSVVNLSANVAGFKDLVGTIQTQLERDTTSLQAQLTAIASNRYSSIEATADRQTYMRAIELLQKNDADHDKIIRELSVSIAEMRGRQPEKPRP